MPSNHIDTDDPQTAIVISDDETDDLDALPPPRKPLPPRRLHPRGTCTTVTDDDDDDDDDDTPATPAPPSPDLSFRKRRPPPTTKISSDSSSPTLPRRKRAKRTATATTHAPVVWDFSDSDGGGLSKGPHPSTSQPLPSHLQQKKAVLDAAKSAPIPLLSALKLPPTFPPDSTDLATLESRPQFSIPPCAEYKDIPLPDSGGVIPCAIAQHLRPYQVAGVAFLHRAFVFQEGVVLGDDMGLGKTVQVIAFLAAAFGKTGDERDAGRMRRAVGWYPRVLVICPSSLIANWVKELDTWGWWVVYVYHGAKEEKDAALAAARKGRLEIMITNYETYRTRAGEINTVDWDCVVADECHKIKERTSETTQRMNDINALCRIGLTGTAIQNKYEELWTLLNWCRPGAVGTLQEWQREISEPLKRGQAHGATYGEIGRARRVATMLVKNLLPRMFLRRMKTLIAHQLPRKSDRVVFCPLTETQKDAYAAYLETETIAMIKHSSDPCPCGSRKRRGRCCFKTDAQGRRINELVFPAIMWVQKLSNHLSNWVPDETDPSDIRAQKLDLLQTCLPDRWRELVGRERLLNYMDPSMCGKWLVLKKLLRFWHGNGDKVLLFSYSIALLGMLRALFRKTEYNVCYLDGSMNLPDRARAVETFNTDPDMFVFLISTKAGGVGLNITAANKVVIFDPNWNPAYDLQAQDRAYRIGQTRDVEVFRLISAGTVEEIVYARQIYKQQQANIGYDASTERRYFQGVMGTENRGELFGLRNIFTLRDEPILREIVNKTNVAETRAGVLVADLVAEGEAGEADEDGGLRHTVSQLEPELGITRRKSNTPSSQQRQIDPIAAILAEAGVEYTHENSEVVGSSRMEAEISRRAMMKGGGEMRKGDRVAFEEEDVGVRFRPPVEVRRRQFCEAARLLGFADVGKFALVVEGWNQQQRRAALARFYELRRKARMGVVGGEEGEGEGNEEEQGGQGEREGSAEEEEVGEETEDFDDEDDEL